jgi:hypothetical protein
MTFTFLRESTWHIGRSSTMQGPVFCSEGSGPRYSSGTERVKAKKGKGEEKNKRIRDIGYKI